MERIINLPSVDAINEFVKSAGESSEMVLVSKEGYKFQIDGASLLGMMTLLGENIIVKCMGSADGLAGIFARYSVAR